MIAHKLESAVRYSDKVLVMDQGTMKEFDTAEKLLDLDSRTKEIRSQTIFASMIKALNPNQQAQIFTHITKSQTLLNASHVKPCANCDQTTLTYCSEHDAQESAWRLP